MITSDNEILVVTSEDRDWYGLYVDGELKCEGHRLTHSNIFYALGINYTEFEKDDTWFDDFGCCPEKYPAEI